MLKIAFPTDDGETISRHLGRAPFYTVVTLDHNEPPRMEQREKPHHAAYGAQHTQHGHLEMFDPIGDCQVLVAGGMGQPAYDRALAKAYEVILTGETSIQAAVEAYQRGQLETERWRVHAPHAH